MDYDRGTIACIQYISMITDPIQEWIFMDSLLINPVEFETAPQESHIGYNALPYFFHCLSQHRFANQILRSIKNVWILVGTKKSENLLRLHEKKWEDYIGPDELAELDRTGTIPLGFILLDHSAGDYVGIRWIETYIRHQNLGTHIIRMIERKQQKKLVPLSVEFSFGFWVKYFMHYMNIKSSQDLRMFFSGFLQMPIISIYGYRDLQIGLDMPPDEQ
jgi:hypothetical protein